MNEQHLKDYVWMKLPWGEPERVPTEPPELIAQKMNAGFGQCEPPEGEKED